MITNLLVLNTSWVRPPYTWVSGKRHQETETVLLMNRDSVASIIAVFPDASQTKTESLVTAIPVTLVPSPVIVSGLTSRTFSCRKIIVADDIDDGDHYISVLHMGYFTSF